MLDLSPGIDDLGVVRWQLVLCFLLAWIIIMACISKGIKSVGKVSESMKIVISLVKIHVQ